jgi:ferritin-like metal-binding protein YciE
LKHLDETKTHVTRLEQVFQMHGAEVNALLLQPSAAESAGIIADI